MLGTISFIEILNEFRSQFIIVIDLNTHIYVV